MRPMIAVPAVDLRGGRCVQLVGGRPEEEKVSLADPVEIARGWWENGFRQLHVVDLDAALGSGHNRELVAELCTVTDAVVQVGGGLRDDDAVARVLESGARRAIVGTRAVEDPEWLARMAGEHPGRLVVAADVREGVVLRRGWTEGSGQEVEAFVDGLADLPLAGILCTDVGREGRMEGIDLEAMAAVIDATDHPVQVSGGVTSMEDLRSLDAARAAGAVLGMALYTGALDPETVAREYGGEPGGEEPGD